MKKIVNFIYIIGAALIILGSVIDLILGIYFGVILRKMTIICIMIFQCWVIEKLFRQINDKER